jgi:hypothetical protein
MSPQPPEETAEEGPSAPMVPWDDDRERVDHLRQILRSFNHRCRNSLNGIKMSLYLFKREASGPMSRRMIDLERTYREIERSFDRFQVIYRPFSLTMVRSPFGQLVADRLASWRSWFHSNRRSFEIDPPDQDLAGDFDPIYLGLALDALVAWRADSTSLASQPRLSWEIADGCFDVRWDEGCSAMNGGEQGEENGSCETSAHFAQGDSLALPLLARVLAAHGGRNEAAWVPALAIRLRWPQLQNGARGQ